jgi:TonB family protein
VFRIGQEGITAPTLVRQVRPEYTKLARKATMMGVLVLYAEISPDGRAQKIKIAINSLDPALDRQAIVALKQWRFAPGRKADKPVTVAVTIEVCFGSVCRHGTHVGTNFKRAVEVYTDEAKKGNPDAEYALGAIYYRERQFGEARLWFEKAAAKGLSQAEYSLGIIYARGQGVDPDLREAQRWYQKAAAHPDEDNPAFVIPDKTVEPEWTVISNLRSCHRDLSFCPID